MKRIGKTLKNTWQSARVVNRMVMANTDEFADGQWQARAVVGICGGDAR